MLRVRGGFTSGEVAPLWVWVEEFSALMAGWSRRPNISSFMRATVEGVPRAGTARRIPHWQTRTRGVLRLYGAVRPVSSRPAVYTHQAFLGARTWASLSPRRGDRRPRVP